MPEMDGFEATAGIRALPEPKNRISIIALTANAMQGEDKVCRSKGMDDYLAKPIDVPKLARALERWGTARSNARPPAEPPLKKPAEPAPRVNTDSVDRAAIDLLIHSAGSDRALGLIQTFCLEAHTSMQIIQRLAAQHDLENLVDRAHNLKGTSGNFGAWSLYEDAKRLEFAARQGDLDLVHSLIPGISTLVTEVTASLEHIARRIKADSEALEGGASAAVR